MNTSTIVPGSYSLTYVLYEIGQYGTDLNQDILRDIYSITIGTVPKFNHDMPWLSRWWGYNTIGELIER